MEWTIPAFAFPAEAGTHLPTPEGWKAELALGGWLVTKGKRSTNCDWISFYCFTQFVFELCFIIFVWSVLFLCDDK